MRQRTEQDLHSYMNINKLYYTHFTKDLHFTTLYFSSIQFTSIHFTSLHFTLHSLFPSSFERYFQKNLHFSFLIITFLTVFLKQNMWFTGKVTSASAGSGSTIWMSYLQRSIYRYLFLVSCSRSMVLVICPLQLSMPVIRCMLWRRRKCELSSNATPSLPRPNRSHDLKI
jgi:hypothetical protein